MQYRKALINASCPKMTKQEYDIYMGRFYKEHPFYAENGKISPYTNMPIQTWHDYMLYGHCFVMKQLTENRLSSIDEKYHAQIEDLEQKFAKSSSDLRASNKSCADLSHENEKLRFSNRAFLCLLFVVVALAILFVFIIPNPLEDDLKKLKDANASLTTSLAEAEQEVLSLQDALNYSYLEGYFDAEKAYSASSSSSYHTYVPYNSTPITDISYIGNRSTKKFHRSDCSYLPSQENQVLLTTRDYAVSQGYDPCKRCDP